MSSLSLLGDLITENSKIPSLRGSKAEGAIARNSKIPRGILRRNFSLRNSSFRNSRIPRLFGVREYFLGILDLGILV